ncbi:MAG: TlpA disulfide reductase family protein [Chloroflexota bacterium]
MRHFKLILPVLLLMTVGCTFSQALQAFQPAVKVAAQVTDQPSPTMTTTATPSAVPTAAGTTLSKSQALQLTLQAGLDPAMTVEPGIDPSITLRSGIGPALPSQPDDTPNFYITTFDGKTFTLGDYRGKIVVVNFWASWCGPCRAETPALVKLWDVYKDRDVVFVGVATDDLPEAVAAFAKSYHVNYLAGPDLNSDIGVAYFVMALPTTLIIGKDGTTLTRLPGATNEKQMRQLLDKLLPKQ